MISDNDTLRKCCDERNENRDNRISSYIIDNNIILHCYIHTNTIKNVIGDKSVDEIVERVNRDVCDGRCKIEIGEFGEIGDAIATNAWVSAYEPETMILSCYLEYEDCNQAKFKYDELNEKLDSWVSFNFHIVSLGKYCGCIY